MAIQDIPKTASNLHRSLGRFQLFALGFGAIVGSAWIVILSDWLSGGPGGAIVGFILGGTVILAIGCCYAELTKRFPRTGGEFTFCLEIYGPRTAFFVGWFVALAWICVTIFEGIAVPRFLAMLIPDLDDAPLYTAFGSPVSRNEILVGAAGALLIGGINYLGAKFSGRFQAWLTYAFLIVSSALLLRTISWGSLPNLLPLFPNDPAHIWWAGALAIFGNCAFLLNGFQSVAQAVEERREIISLRTISKIMIISIIAGTSFYIIAVFAASCVVPWPRSAETPFPLIYATQRLPFGNILAPLLLLAVIASLLKTWNAVFLMASRVILALSRHSALPNALSHVDPDTGSPQRAIILVAALNICGLFLGRGAINMIVDMTSICLVACFFLCSLGAFILRRRFNDAAEFNQFGGAYLIYLAIIGSFFMAVSALIGPALSGRSLPVEYVLLLTWLVAGSILWNYAAFRRRTQ